MVSQHNFSLRSSRCVTQALCQEIWWWKWKQVWSLVALFTAPICNTPPKLCLWFQKGAVALTEETVLCCNCDIITRSRNRNAASFLDEIQQPNDSLIFVHFLISSVNEQFDQAELEIRGCSADIFIKECVWMVLQCARIQASRISSGEQRTVPTISHQYEEGFPAIELSV